MCASKADGGPSVRRLPRTKYLGLQTLETSSPFGLLRHCAIFFREFFHFIEKPSFGFLLFQLLKSRFSGLKCHIFGLFGTVRLFSIFCMFQTLEVVLMKFYPVVSSLALAWALFSSMPIPISGYCIVFYL